MKCTLAEWLAIPPATAATVAAVEITDRHPREVSPGVFTWHALPGEPRIVPVDLKHKLSFHRLAGDRGQYRSHADAMTALSECLVKMARSNANTDAG